MVPTAGAIEHVVALVIPLHASADGPSGKIGFGSAVKLPIVVGAALTVTVAVLVTLPPGPVTVSV
jgi:hypothetical protein